MLKNLSRVALVAATVMLASCAMNKPATTEAAACPNSAHPYKCCQEACDMTGDHHKECTEKCMKHCKKHHHKMKAKHHAAKAAPAAANGDTMKETKDAAPADATQGQ